MSHRIYHTEGYILASRNVGETNRLFFILTPDLGLIRATAQGVRKMHSKLRGHLVNYSHLFLSVVRGKEYWRLVSAEERELSEDKHARAVQAELLAKVGALLTRLMAEEGGHKSEEIFLEVSGALKLAALSAGDAEFLVNLEYVLILRLMRHLGYIKEEPKLAEFVSSTEWSTSIIDHMADRHALAAQVINASLEQSHI